MLEESIEQYKRYLLLCYLKKLLIQKKNLNKKVSIEEEMVCQEVKKEGYIGGYKEEGIILNDFSNHISKFTGETVTIYVIAGGMAGEGFTGILLKANRDFATIIDVISTDINYLEQSIDEGLGAIVDIPIEKIVAFVHNTV